jgi:hypothetical protein
MDFAVVHNNIEAVRRILTLHPEAYYPVKDDFHDLITEVFCNDHYQMISFLLINCPGILQRIRDNLEASECRPLGKIMGYMDHGKLKPGVATALIDICLHDPLAAYDICKMSKVHPIRFLCKYIQIPCPVSHEADLFRLLLKQNPVAATDLSDDIMKDMSHAHFGRGENDWNLYESYFYRLVLRSDPEINPMEYRRLNYISRRMAMFLAFHAISSGSVELTMLRRLKLENIALLKLVVSFL